MTTFIAAAWGQSDYIIASLGTYIREHIEKNFLQGNLGWEHYYASIRDPGRFGSLAHLASRGIFGGTQLLTIILGLLKSSFPTEDIFLLILDFFAVILTQIILKQSTLAAGGATVNPTDSTTQMPMD